MPNLHKIRLSEAPEIIFDAEEWRKFIETSEDRYAALALLNWHTIDLVGAMDCHNGRSLVARTLLAECQRRLIEGSLVLTGVLPGAPQSVEIAAELWATLKINFFDETAESDTHRFGSLCLLVDKTKFTNTDAIMHISAWLRVRKAEGLENKERLRELAKRCFGEVCKDRIFNSAYSSVFGRKVDRPQRT